MGNASSTDKSLREYKTLENVLDYIASNYILTSDFKTLTNLHEEQYCQDLVILTRDILDKNFNEMELTYLSQRVKGKETIDEEKREKFMYTTKNKLEKADKSSSLRKKRLCQGISKFYVKIGHVYAAIVTTINPIYSYKDEEGNIVKTPLSQKDTIPKNAKDRKLLRNGLCYNRINQLRHGQDFVNIPEDGNITLSPDICGDNVDLMDEPGIPELEALYFDKFDYKTGAFSSMRESTKKKYKEDVEKFYKAFTGKDTMPEEPINSFSDIKLSAFDKNDVCSTRNPKKEKVTGNLKDELFQKYALTLQGMVKKSYNVQERLLEIINQMFTFDVDKKENKRVVRIHPKLNESLLSEIIDKTRTLILNYYLTCEKDYTKAVKLYETIVNNQIRETTMNQVEDLEETKEKLLNQ